MTRNVSLQTCPSCSREVPADVLVCDCGHDLRDNVATTSGPEGYVPSTPEQELFVSYLIARVEQAREELDAVRLELESQPGDLGKAMEVMEAVQNLRIARVELDQRLGRASPFSDAIQDQPSDEFRAQQSARAQLAMESADGSPDDAAPAPYRRGRSTSSADPLQREKRHDK